jgi:ABC-type uncharacterized transport system ATPase component
MPENNNTCADLTIWENLFIPHSRGEQSAWSGIEEDDCVKKKVRAFLKRPAPS